MSKVFYNQISNIISEASDSFICILNGDEINSIEKFYQHIANGLQFPDYFGENLDALDEMLYDLDWIEQQFVILIIYNSDHFLQNDLVKKAEIIQLLEEIDNPYLEIFFVSKSI
mgnify:CR=1 FL=1